MNEICQNISNDVLFKAENKSAFGEMGVTLYLFVRRLYDQARKEGVKDLFFFAREGMLLKEMFDFYLEEVKGEYQVRTNYLRVSRKSTFMVSLDKLEVEEFETLFRQYRSISVEEFLKSLALDEYLNLIAEDMNVGKQELQERRPDLPTDDIFNKLKQSVVFKNIYEEERSKRRDAFEEYIASFFDDGAIPNRLDVVDVGWKGTIQDNLYSWLENRSNNRAVLKGYYVGVVAPGSMSERNRKEGLLFSSLSGISKGFQVFNENKSLYEVLLHANHGSAQRYEFDDLGRSIVVEDVFQEKIMIEEKVVPKANAMMHVFKRCCVQPNVKSMSDMELLHLALKLHARMVFRPSEDEIRWILSVSHVENFGVFEESKFDMRGNRFDLFDRFKFTTNLFMKRRPSELGFWPWLTIRRRALPGLNWVYRAFRKLQCGF